MGAQGTTEVTSERSGAGDNGARVQGTEPAAIVAGLVSRARVAMEHVSRFGQEQVDAAADEPDPVDRTGSKPRRATVV